ncbi:hypothetical protein AWRI1499_1960 [Brettanomyces bruxellensis AWRI1499]|nr:hypothetical protein AWRI1499_1960 [Brettanomyces bruxellensis AWRI1499]
MNGELGLGVINSTLYEGTLTYVDSVSGSLSGGWYVNLDGISDSSGNTISSSSGVALLDASSTVNYLPSSVIASISETLNGTYDSSLGLYQVNCHDISISKETLDFSFR